MVNPELRGDSFLIVGFGREGRSVLEYLRARRPGARVGIADRQGRVEDSASDESVEWYLGNSYLSAAATFDTVIRSPGVSIREVQPSLSEHAHLTSATNIFFAECPGTIVGVTGTKGKSTTSSLSAAILKQAFPDVRLVGNIGVPMLDYLHGATSETVFVVELSSYQLEDLRRSPRVAVLLNIVPEHLDYHGGFEAYCAAKCNIARHQQPGDTLVMNSSFSGIARLTEPFVVRRALFREAHHQDSLVVVRDGEIVVRRGEDEILMKVSELPVKGPGNLQNALAAVTVGVTLGMSLEQIRDGIASFIPLEHRLEFVAERAGIQFYNDSLSTIPEAMAHALVALGEEVETIIAGGFDRGVDMTAVGPALATSNVKNLILFPTTGEKIWLAAKAAAPSKEYFRVDVSSMEEAVQAAYDYTSPGKICVMSPASSSFSVFRDYRERGEKFKDAVRSMGPSRLAAGGEG